MLIKKQLLELWKKYDFKPNKRLGQNFLIDKNVKDKIIRYINPKENDIILEIGAGFAELTKDLSNRVKRVIALEKDKRITHVLKSEVLKDINNIKIEESDFLKYRLRNKFSKIVGNLPYYITTPIIERFLEPEFKGIGGIFIMVQREYANRMMAIPRSKDYSSLSCFVQYRMDIAKLMSISRYCFFPKPEVDSVFLKLNILRTPRVKVHDEDLLSNIIRCAFQQRRKTLVNSLSKKILNIEKDELTRVLQDLGINRNSRPEELSLEEFGKIGDRLWERKR